MLYVYLYLFAASSVPISLRQVLDHNPVKSCSMALSSQWHNVFPNELAVLIIA